MSIYIWDDYSPNTFYKLEYDDTYKELYTSDRGDHIININRSQRAKQIFFERADGRLMSGDEQRERLENLNECSTEVNCIVHILRQLDQDNSLTRLSYDKQYYMTELLNSERYGSEAAELFRKISGKMQETILYFMVYKDSIHNRKILLGRVAEELFDSVVLYNYDRRKSDKTDLIVFTLSKGDEAERCAWELAVLLFQELFTEVKIVWDTSPLIIGERYLANEMTNYYTLYDTSGG